MKLSKITLNVYYSLCRWIADHNYLPTHEELAPLLEMDRTTVAYHIEKLEEAKWVVQERQENGRVLNRTTRPVGMSITIIPKIQEVPTKETP